MRCHDRSVRSQGLRQLTERLEDFSAPALGYDIFWMLRADLFVSSESFRQTTECLEHFGAPSLGHDIFRILGASLLVNSESFGQLPKRLEDVGVSFFRDQKLSKRTCLFVSVDRIVKPTGI